MKKFLSLVLALVMTMSLVTVSAGAKDFTDDSKINYDEAVSVISAVKVVDGYTDGSFNPQGQLTRGAAAKIICNLILGPTTAAELSADTAPYKDVATNHTFAGYIAYCAKEGIISGYADGSFRPSASLTGYAFMKMLLGALGYDQEIEGFVGPNWSIAVAKKALGTGIGLNAGLKTNFVGTKPVTREEAALYAFNTLQATMVAYDSKTSVNVNGAQIAIGNTDAKPVTWAEGINNDGQIKKDGFVQFAEQYFTKLTCKAGEDAFMRPTNDWSIGKEKIGSFVDYTQKVAEYTTAVSGAELYDVVGKTAFDDYKFTSYVDGTATNMHKEVAKNNKANVTGSGNAALLEVFVNNDDEEVVITIVNTYLAQASGDYSEKKDSATFKIYADADHPSYKTDVVYADDVAYDISKVEDEQFVLVTMTKADHEIQSVEDVKVIADTEISKFKSGKDGYVVVDGDKYNYSKMAEYDYEVLEQYTVEGGAITNLKDLTYNVYTVEMGGVEYVIGVDLVKTPDNFLFITGADDSTSNLSNKTWAANAIFMDGTSKVIDVKNNGAVTNNALVNSWYTYTVSNDNVYTLKEVNDTTAITAGGNGKYAQARTYAYQMDEIDAKHIELKGIGADDTVYGNDASIYMLAELDRVNDMAVISGVDEVVTGVKNAAFEIYNRDEAANAVKPAVTSDDTKVSFGVYTLYKSNGYVMAAVVVGESNSVADKLAYFHTDKISSESYDKNTKMWTWTRNAIINGEEVELVETNDTGVSVLKATGLKNQWVTVKYDAADHVKELDTAVSHKVTTMAGAAAEVKKSGVKTVVLDNTATNNKYSLKGSSLYDETNGKKGFLVAENVKIALEQEVKNVKSWTYYDGIKSLENILDNLNTNTTLSYELDAVIVDGFATVVVLRDLANDDGFVSPNGGSNKVIATVDTVLKHISLKKTSDVQPNADEADRASISALAAAGYEATTRSYVGADGKYYIDAVRVDSMNPAPIHFTVAWAN